MLSKPKSKTLPKKRGSRFPVAAAAGPYETLAIRRGVLLRATLRKPGTKDVTRISRTVRQATQLGLRIYQNFDVYSARVQQIVEQMMAKQGYEDIEFWIQTKEWMRSKYAPGLILDFPAFRFRLGRYLATGRCCVTICYADTVSKVWSRLVLDAEPVPGDPIEALSQTEIERHLKLGAKISSALNQAIRKLYLADFREAIDCPPDAIVRFEKVGALDYFGLDEDPTLIAKAMDAAEEDRPLSEEPLRPLQRHFDMLARANDDDNRDTTENFDLSKDVLHAFNGENGYPAVFASSVKRGTATFLVASARRDSLPVIDQEQLHRKRDSSALDIMRELSTLLASRF